MLGPSGELSLPPVDDKRGGRKPAVGIWILQQGIKWSQIATLAGFKPQNYDAPSGLACQPYIPTNPLQNLGFFDAQHRPATRSLSTCAERARGTCPHFWHARLTWLQHRLLGSR